MKIFFSGSIRGGREDVSLYADIIVLLKQYGEVLTEHIADSNLSSYGQLRMTDQEIHTKDTTWLRECDVVVAEVTATSLGVGYELGFAEANGKKVICLYRPSEGKLLSAMLRGNKNFTVIEYQTVEDLAPVFRQIFEGL